MGLITALATGGLSGGKGKSGGDNGGGLVTQLLRKKATPYDPMAEPDSYKRGGQVKKSGMAKVHKGERVLTKSQNKRYSKKSGK